MSITKERYVNNAVPALMKQYGITNKFAVPRIEKVVLNIGLSKGLKDKRYIDVGVETLTRISGQKPVLTRAKKSISNFKIRQGQVVGAAVTLRGRRMYDFFDKLTLVVFPRMRDFHGLDPARGFDNTGNFSIGVLEHIIFPEIGSDEIENLHGLEITVVTTAKNRDEARTLLEQIGFPFKKQ